MRLLQAYDMSFAGLKRIKIVGAEFQWLVFSVLMTVLAFVLIGRRVGNICFYALVFLALASLLKPFRPNNRKFLNLLGDYWPLHLAMAGMVMAIFINQLLLNDFTARSYDYPSRMALFPLLLWVILLIPYGLMRFLQWAYVAGAFLATAKMFVITKGGTDWTYVDFMPIIEFGQLAMLLGFFSLLSLAYQEKNSFVQRIGIVLKLLAGLAGLYAAYLSRTRGAWIGIPVFVLITIAMLGDGVKIRKRLSIGIVLTTLVITMFGATSLVQSRVGSAREEFVQYFQGGNADTSVGVRLQLWKGSLLLFSEHPLIGVGKEHFYEALGDLEKRGVLTHMARDQPHSHNEIFYNMSILGTFGLIAILSLYFVPFIYFFRDTRHPDREIRATAAMGLTLCLGFLILGLVDVMFMWGVSDNFYAIFLAAFSAYILKRKEILQGDLTLQKTG